MSTHLIQVEVDKKLQIKDGPLMLHLRNGGCSVNLTYSSYKLTVTLDLTQNNDYNHTRWISACDPQNHYVEIVEIVAT
eukprot:981840-Amorphochlora_amoeboformis.AAC.1